MVTEDGFREILNRLLSADLSEMGVLPAKKAAEKETAAPVGSKSAPLTGAAAQGGAGKAAKPASRVPFPVFQAPTTEVAEERELWTMVVSRTSKKAETRAAKDMAKVHPKNPPATTIEASQKKKNEGRGGGKGGFSRLTTGISGARGPAKAPKIKPPTTVAVAVTCVNPSAYAEVLKTARESQPLLPRN